MEGEKTLIVRKAGRLDEAISDALGISRSKAQLIVDNGIEIKGRDRKASYRVEEGEILTYIPLKEKPSKIVPNPSLEVPVVYEDEDILVFNKPRGLVVHTAPGHDTDTLVNFLASQSDKFKFDEEEMAGGRPGIIHRIDKDTSGLLMVAKTPKAMALLQEDIKHHRVQREYVALCWGDVNEDSFTVDVPLTKPNHTLRRALASPQGHKAVSHFEKIWSKNGVSLVRVNLETGRTHQIRAHLAYIGHSIVGDMLYGNKEEHHFSKGQLLHAFRLTFTHPMTKKEMTLTAPMDDYFRTAIDLFYGEGKKLF